MNMNKKGILVDVLLKLIVGYIIWRVKNCGFGWLWYKNFFLWIVVVVFYINFFLNFILIMLFLFI